MKTNIVLITTGILSACLVDNNNIVGDISLIILLTISIIGLIKTIYGNQNKVE